WSAPCRPWLHRRNACSITMRPVQASASSCRPSRMRMPTLTDPTYLRQGRAYLKLRRHWRRDPVAYVAQRFGAQPTWQQVQILQAIAPPGPKVSIRSGHGIGKTTAAAWGVLWHLETHDFAKVPCTAPSSHQLRD